MNAIIELQKETPLEFNSYAVGDKRVGLIVVDEVNGFCKPGAGNLAPPVEDPVISGMVEKTVQLVERQLEKQLPVMFFLDTHTPGKAEPPYPPHCEQGTGEEELVDELKPFAKNALVIETDGVVSNPSMLGVTKITLLKKDCINGFVGATRVLSNGKNQNHIVDWVNQNNLETVVVVGICTSICVMQFVQTLLSARNHDMMPTLEDVVVYESACGDYNLPRDVAESLGLPASASHPRSVSHYMGLWFMMQSGAILTNDLQ